jgi:two-component system, NtrC family, sensor kinase
VKSGRVTKAELQARITSLEHALHIRDEALSKALDQQTATAEILRVISSSPTDVHPVFHAIVESARRLLAGYSATAYRRVGDEIHLAGGSGPS